MPFHTWDTKVIEAIGQRFGSCIGVAKETMEKSESGSRRVCVHSEIQSFINKEIELEILGKLFLVSVREELVWQQQHGFGMSMDLQFSKGSFSFGGDEVQGEDRGVDKGSMASVTRRVGVEDGGNCEGFIPSTYG